MNEEKYWKTFHSQPSKSNYDLSVAIFLCYAVFGWEKFPFIFNILCIWMQNNAFQSESAANIDRLPKFKLFETSINSQCFFCKLSTWYQLNSIRQCWYLHSFKVLVAAENELFYEQHTALHQKTLSFFLIPFSVLSKSPEHTISNR